MTTEWHIRHDVTGKYRCVSGLGPDYWGDDASEAITFDVFTAARFIVLSDWRDVHLVRALETKRKSIGSIAMSALDELARRAMRPATEEDKARVEAQVAEFESRHGMTSEEMQDKLRRGEIEETWEVCQWLLNIALRNWVCKGRWEP